MFDSVKLPSVSSVITLLRGRRKIDLSTRNVKLTSRADPPASLNVNPIFPFRTPNLKTVFSDY